MVLYKMLKTTKKILPGQPGAKKLAQKYGDRLVCVRYKEDSDARQRIKTIELVYGRSPLTPKSHRIPANKNVPIRITYGEKGLGILVRQTGGRWDKAEKVWYLPYGQVLALGLENRMIQDTS